MSSNLEPTDLNVTSDINTPSTADTVNTVSTPTTPATETAVNKKAKKEKDPNAPKRPLNAYFLFQRDYRPKLKSANPDLPHTDQNKLLSEAWEKMSLEERTRYEGEAKGLYEEYAKEIKEYKGVKSIGSVDEATSTSEQSPVRSQSQYPVQDQGNTHHFIANADLAHVAASSDAEPAKKKKKKNREKREQQEE